MQRPTRPPAPLQALRSDPVTFAQRTEDWIGYQAAALPDWMEGLTDYMEVQADISAAGFDPTALANTTPTANQDIVVREGDQVRVSALQSLLVTSGFMLPVGSVLPFVGENPPSGFFVCDGASFSGMPDLAAVLGGSTLPDLRGEFIRGWDQGRGVDALRSILSQQMDSIQNITGSINKISETWNLSGQATGAFSKVGGYVAAGTPSSIDSSSSGAVNFDASLVARTSSETRPRNIALNFIIRHDHE